MERNRVIEWLATRWSVLDFVSKSLSSILSFGSGSKACRILLVAFAYLSSDYRDL
jgi:hypothetical protein